MHALTVHLTDHIHDRITALAEARGPSTEDLCTELLYRLTKALAHAPLARLWAEGLTDAEIADQLGIVLHSVSTRRRALHLPPNTINTRKASNP